MTGSERDVAGRSPWMKDHVALLVELLNKDHGVPLPHGIARAGVADYVNLVASVMSSSRYAVRRHLTEDVLRDMAADITSRLNGPANRG